MLFADSLVLTDNMEYKTVTGEGDGHKHLEKTYSTPKAMYGKMFFNQKRMVTTEQGDKRSFNYVYDGIIFMTDIELSINAMVRLQDGTQWYKIKGITKQEDVYSEIYVYTVVKQ